MPDAGVLQPALGVPTPGSGVWKSNAGDTMPEAGDNIPEVGVRNPESGHPNPGAGGRLAEGGLYLGDVGRQKAVDTVHQAVESQLGLGELALELLLLGGHRGGGPLLVQPQ